MFLADPPHPNNVADRRMVGTGRKPKELCRGATDLTTLMDAAIDGHKQLIELLLRRGAEIDKQNGKGGTALMGAAQEGHERAVELLLQRGAEINKQNSDGCTALMFAAGVEVKRVGR